MCLFNSSPFFFTSSFGGGSLPSEFLPSSLTGFYNGSRGGSGSSGGCCGVVSLTGGKSGLPGGFLV